MYLKENEIDVASVLADIAGNIRDFNKPVDLCLDHFGEDEVLNPFEPGARADSITIDDPIPNGFLGRLGIRHVISNASPGKLEIQVHLDMGNNRNSKGPCRWNNLKNDAVIESLQTIIGDSPVIQFADWAKTDDASGYWNGLFSDVIKPLNRRDFEFVFQLGDITKKLAFEVDEILDIVGDYSSYGRVTLMLDENEADKLWSRLHGQDTGATISGFRPHNTKEKYLFLFNTMKIDVLLVLCGSHTVLLSEDWQFDIAGSSLKDINTSVYARDCFITGYQIGLLLHFDIPHCVALGQAVSGTYVENASRPSSKALLAFINAWMAELKQMTARDSLSPLVSTV